MCAADLPDSAAAFAEPGARERFPAPAGFPETKPSVARHSRVERLNTAEGSVVLPHSGPEAFPTEKRNQTLRLKSGV